MTLDNEVAIPLFTFNKINNNINKIQHANINETNNIITKSEFIKVLENNKPAENVISFGNCGLYAICNTFNDNKEKRVASIVNLLELLHLSKLPNHWWFDDELASTANHYNRHTYIFNACEKTAVIHGNGIRTPVMLYIVNKSTHWIPGTKSLNSNRKIPNNYIHKNVIQPLEK